MEYYIQNMSWRSEYDDLNHFFLDVDQINFFKYQKYVFFYANGPRYNESLKKITNSKQSTDC